MTYYNLDFQFILFYRPIIIFSFVVVLKIYYQHLKNQLCQIINFVPFGFNYFLFKSLISIYLTYHSFFSFLEVERYLNIIFFYFYLLLALTLIIILGLDLKDGLITYFLLNFYQLKLLVLNYFQRYQLKIHFHCLLLQLPLMYMPSFSLFIKYLENSLIFFRFYYFNYFYFHLLNRYLINFSVECSFIQTFYAKIMI